MPEESPVTPVETAPAAPVEAPAAPAETPQPNTVDALPDWAQKLVRDARKEAGDYRTAAKTAADKAAQDLTDKIAVSLGLKPDAAVDPAALTASLTAAQAAQRDAAVQLAVYKAAGAAQANPDALLDSASFLAKVRDLDPTAGDFATQVNTAISDALLANPLLKTVRAAGASGIELGGTGETGQITEAQLKRMSPDEIVAAQAKGLLRDLLG